MRRDPDITGPLKRIRPVWMVGVQNSNFKTQLSRKRVESVLSFS
jgi:hypothetical protein